MVSVWRADTKDGLTAIPKMFSVVVLNPPPSATEKLGFGKREFGFGHKK
jgi:hypothetical protein